MYWGDIMMGVLNFIKNLLILDNQRAGMFVFVTIVLYLIFKDKKANVTEVMKKILSFFTVVVEIIMHYK
jgi:hypothetical protein